MSCPDGSPGAKKAPAIVQLSNVSKSYGSTAALRQVSLDIHQGEFLTLLGPSGCGKTTTLRLISGFEIPDAGRILIGGQVMNHVPPFRRDVNTVFQNYALFPHMTVFDNVAYGLTVKRLARDRIRPRVLDMLQTVGLEDKARSLPRELSGGQMQRVALARALINEPRVLLLDEPLGALDAKLRRTMQIELRRIHNTTGLTFVCVTHDQEEALVMSDRIAVMNEGRIAQLGTPRETFETPRSRFVADFIGGCNFLSAVVTPDRRGVELPNAVRWSVDLPEGCTARERVTLAIRPQKVRLQSCGYVESNGRATFEARVIDIVYVGSTLRVVLELVPGVEFTSEMLDPLLAPHKMAVGAEVAVSVAPQDILIYRQDAES